MKTEWSTNDFGHVYKGKTLVKSRTQFQRIESIENPTFGTCLFLDGKIQISDGDENRYHQYLVAAPLLAHRQPRSMCVVGGGDCFALEEAVKFSSLKRILMVEIDKGVVDFCRKHYRDVRKALKDPRIELEFQDARQRLEKNTEKFDVLIIDLTEPHGPSTMLYTKEFYRLCKKRLTPGGILSIHTDNYFLFPDSFATIYKTVKSIFKNLQTARVDMPCFGMQWTYRLASDQPIALKRMENKLKAMRRLGKKFDHFTPSLYRCEATPEELNVLKKHGKISTDKKPFDKFAKLNAYVTR